MLSKLGVRTPPPLKISPSSAHQHNAIEMAFRLRAKDGPFCLFGICYLRNIGTDLLYPQYNKLINLSKIYVVKSWTPIDETFGIGA